MQVIIRSVFFFTVIVFLAGVLLASSANCCRAANTSTISPDIKLTDQEIVWLKLLAGGVAHDLNNILSGIVG